jgi:hypothetical protein
MEIVVLPKSRRDNEVGCGGIQEHAPYEADLCWLSRQVNVCKKNGQSDTEGYLSRAISTVYISRVVEINPQNPPRGQPKYQNVVGNLGCHEIGSNVELKLDSLNVEDRKTCV